MAEPKWKVGDELVNDNVPNKRIKIINARTVGGLEEEYENEYDISVSNSASAFGMIKTNANHVREVDLEGWHLKERDDGNTES